MLLRRSSLPVVSGLTVSSTSVRYVQLQYNVGAYVASVKPGSQYDAGAYVASVKPGSQYDTGAYVASVKPGSQYDAGAYVASVTLE